MRLIPRVDCGAVELWGGTPALPAGLQIDPLTGILSGQALADGDSLHLIRAENEFGFVEVSLEILIRSSPMRAHESATPHPPVRRACQADYRPHSRRA